MIWFVFKRGTQYIMILVPMLIHMNMLSYAITSILRHTIETNISYEKLLLSVITKYFYCNKVFEILNA